MKNKKGFTLVELLAVIVVLGIIMTIATTSVIKNINDSKAKAKYIAAKEIVNIAEAYMEAEGADEDSTEDSPYEKCVIIKTMIDARYLESDTTNPRTGENGFDFSGEDAEQKVCKLKPKDEGENKNNEDESDENYLPNGNCYEFNDYIYVIND